MVCFWDGETHKIEQNELYITGKCSYMGTSLNVNTTNSIIKYEYFPPLKKKKEKFLTMKNGTLGKATLKEEKPCQIVSL